MHSSYDRDCTITEIYQCLTNANYYLVGLSRLVKRINCSHIDRQRVYKLLYTLFNVFYFHDVGITAHRVYDTTGF